MLFQAFIRTSDVQQFNQAALGARRIGAADPHRPVYHLTAPECSLIGFGGCVRWQDEYHVFYRYDPPPKGSVAPAWGHAVSRDLVRWQDWPIAIWPDSSCERQGVGPGNVFVDDQGVPTAIYTGIVNGQKETYGYIARSSDEMLSWDKKVIMGVAPYLGTPAHYHAQVWREDNQWFQLTGGTFEKQGAALLWSSEDLEHWTFRKRIFESDQIGTFWECPYLIMFGDRYALVVDSEPVKYWIGDFDHAKMRFTPSHDEPKLLDHSISWLKPNLHLADLENERRIVFGLIKGGTVTRTVPQWEGIVSLPRTIELVDDRLVQHPVPELEAARGKRYHLEDLTLSPNATGRVGGLQGDVLEMIIRVDPTRTQATRFGVKLRLSDDNAIFTQVFYDIPSASFGVDGNFVRERFSVEAGPSHLAPTDPIELRIFLDRSVLEVFVNGQSKTERIFADRAMRGIAFFAIGGDVQFESIDVWEMNRIW